MNPGFHRHQSAGAVVATFSAGEADLIRSLSRQLIELLHNEQAVLETDPDPLEALLDFSGPTSAPDDPVLARLFPNAYRDDDQAAGDFRRFTEGALRDSKSRAAADVIDVLEEAGLGESPENGVFIDVELDEATAMTWMKSFNDMRLAIGTRLDVAEGDEEFWAALPDDDQRAHVHDIYTYLAYLQETLVEALSDGWAVDAAEGN